MPKILHMVVFLLIFNGCGVGYDINDRSERRTLRKGRSLQQTDLDTNQRPEESGASADAQRENLTPISNPAETNDSTPPPSVEEDDIPNEPELDPAAEGDPNIVVFRIKAGTGESSWNTEAGMIRAKVGQTIRFVNEDSVRHRLHTNGAPCPHGTNFQPGGTYDCVVTRTFDASRSGPLYDHNVGTTAQVWIETTNVNASFSLVDFNEVDEIERPRGACGSH